eukprot:7032636-Prymnesium_polylepis.1
MSGCSNRRSTARNSRPVAVPREKWHPFLGRDPTRDGIQLGPRSRSKVRAWVDGLVCVHGGSSVARQRGTGTRRWLLRLHRGGCALLEVLLVAGGGCALLEVLLVAGG